MVNLLAEKEDKDKIIIAQKVTHKGFLFGHISNGGGIIPLSEDYAMKFIANDKFVTVELYRYGLNVKPQSQSWQKTKAVKQKAKPETKFDIKEESEELF